MHLLGSIVRKRLTEQAPLGYLNFEKREVMGNVEIMSNGKVRKYSSVGGYPMFYVDGGEAYCPECALELSGSLVCGINWESDIHCDECGESIERAY